MKQTFSVSSKPLCSFFRRIEKYINCYLFIDRQLWDSQLSMLPLDQIKKNQNSKVPESTKVIKVNSTGDLIYQNKETHKQYYKDIDVTGLWSSKSLGQSDINPKYSILMQTIARIRSLKNIVDDSKNILMKYAFEKNQILVTFFDGKWTDSRKLDYKLCEVVI